MTYAARLERFNAMAEQIISHFGEVRRSPNNTLSDRVLWRCALAELHHAWGQAFACDDTVRITILPRANR
jgi:hypothetical protein